MLTAGRLREVLFYDPLTGNFTRLLGNYRGRIVGTVVASDKHNASYLRIRVDGGKYYAQRLAWLYVTGDWPVADVDHHDTDGLNNKWSNLRDASRRENKGNAVAYQNNKLGVKGVNVTRNGTYYACIRSRGKSTSLGTFKDLASAEAAYAAAARQVFGAFARS
jgi:hypothetical protein